MSQEGDNQSSAVPPSGFYARVKKNMRHEMPLYPPEMPSCPPPALKAAEHQADIGDDGDASDTLYEEMHPAKDWIKSQALNSGTKCDQALCPADNEYDALQPLPDNDRSSRFPPPTAGNFSQSADVDTENATHSVTAVSSVSEVLGGDECTYDHLDTRSEDLSEQDIYSDLYVDIAIADIQRSASTTLRPSAPGDRSTELVAKRPSLPAINAAPKIVPTKKAYTETKLSHEFGDGVDTSIKSPKSERRLFSRKWKKKSVKEALVTKKSEINFESAPTPANGAGKLAIRRLSTEPILQSDTFPFELVEEYDVGDSRRRISSFNSYLSMKQQSGSPSEASSAPSEKHICLRAHPDEVVTATALDLVQSATKATSVSLNQTDLLFATTESDPSALPFRTTGHSGSFKSDKKRKGFLRRNSPAEQDSCFSQGNAWDPREKSMNRKFSAMDVGPDEAIEHRAYLQDAFFPGGGHWKSSEAAKAENAMAT